MVTWCRRVAPLLLVTGAVLLVGALVWPTHHLDSRTPTGTVRLVDIWFDGRVRAVSDAIEVQREGSPFAVLLVLAASGLLLAAGGVWVVGARPGGRSRSAAPTAVTLAALAVAVAVLALVRSEPFSFGWVGTPEPGLLQTAMTPVALFLPAAALFGALSVAAMLTAVSLRRLTA